MSKIQLFDPIKQQQKVWDEILQVKNSINTLGRQMVKIGNDFNLAKPTLIATNYLISKGIYSFKFIKVLFIRPNVFRFYVQTKDNEFIKVSSDYEDEFITWSDYKFKNKNDMLIDMRDNLILVKELSPPSKIIDDELNTITKLIE